MAAETILDKFLISRLIDPSISNMDARCILTSILTSGRTHVEFFDVGMQQLQCLISFSIRRQYETFSYLPPLTSEQIAKQVDYIINNGWTPCLEFADPTTSFISNENVVRFGNASAVSLIIRR